LALAPGFIDMHSHGNGGLLEDLDAATISRQLEMTAAKPSFAYSIPAPPRRDK
jgi:hypothetical protein